MCVIETREKREESSTEKFMMSDEEVVFYRKVVFLGDDTYICIGE